MAYNLPAIQQGYTTYGLKSEVALRQHSVAVWFASIMQSVSLNSTNCVIHVLECLASMDN